MKILSIDYKLTKNNPAIYVAKIITKLFTL